MTTEKLCQTCGKPFQADNRELKRGNAKYCSRSCSARAPKKLQYPTICKHCGVDFLSASVNAKYCSDSCKQKNYRAKQKSISDESISIKTLYKLFKDIPCELCQWNETSRDLHHIIKVSQGGTNELNNLICVCPNCHRMIHNNLVSKDSILNAIKIRTISSP
ncbi:MAG: HNH endonuclease [Candidatus Saccharimonadaceae bacterium]